MASSGRTQEAVKQLTAAVASEPNYVEARLLLSATLRRAGRLEESLSQYEQVLKIDPQNQEAQKIRSLIPE